MLVSLLGFRAGNQGLTPVQAVNAILDITTLRDTLT